MSDCYIIEEPKNFKDLSLAFQNQNKMIQQVLKENKEIKQSLLFLHEEVQSLRQEIKKSEEENSIFKDKNQKKLSQIYQTTSANAEIYSVFLGALLEPKEIESQNEVRKHYAKIRKHEPSKFKRLDIT